MMNLDNLLRFFATGWRACHPVGGSVVEGLRLGFHPDREPAAAVEGARLDSVPSRHGLPSADFLKPDTKGSELEFLAAARAHWGIEIRLHRIHDMVFHDDLCRLRNGFGPQNFAVMQHTALKLLKQAKTKHNYSFKVTRQMAAWSNDSLENVIRGTS